MNTGCICFIMKQHGDRDGKKLEQFSFELWKLYFNNLEVYIGC